VVQLRINEGGDGGRKPAEALRPRPSTAGAPFLLKELTGLLIEPAAIEAPELRARGVPDDVIATMRGAQDESARQQALNRWTVGSRGQGSEVRGQGEVNSEQWTVTSTSAARAF
jgi:hypothetical protein